MTPGLAKMAVSGSAEGAGSLRNLPLVPLVPFV